MADTQIFLVIDRHDFCKLMTREEKRTVIFTMTVNSFSVTLKMKKIEDF